jgi:hypothetical protein
MSATTMNLNWLRHALAYWSFGYALLHVAAAMGAGTALRMIRPLAGWGAATLSDPVAMGLWMRLLVCFLMIPSAAAAGVGLLLMKRWAPSLCLAVFSVVAAVAAVDLLLALRARGVDSSLFEFSLAIGGVSMSSWYVRRMGG